MANDRTTLRFLAAPADVATNGHTVQAGRVLEWIDKAGYACAVGWARSYCVTAYVGNVHFTRPIPPGSLIEARARIVHTGSSSMHVLVTIDAADPMVGEFTRATHCNLVFVAVDEQGRARTVVPWLPADEEDRMLTVDAISRIGPRARIKAAMGAQSYTEDGTGPRTLFRFLAAPADANFGGKAHGGTVMRWIDEAAATCAAAWSKRESIAIYSGGIHFFTPVRIGDLVEIEARLIHTSARSMHVSIHVRSADPLDGELRLTTQCMSILVAVGDDGRAEPVRQFQPITDEDRRLEAHALELIELRSLMPQPVAYP